MSGFIEDRKYKLWDKLKANNHHISYNNRLLFIEGNFVGHEIIELAELLQLIAIEMKEEYSGFLGTDVNQEIDPWK